MQRRASPRDANRHLLQNARVERVGPRELGPRFERHLVPLAVGHARASHADPTAPERQLTPRRTSPGRRPRRVVLVALTAELRALGLEHRRDRLHGELVHQGEKIAADHGREGQQHLVNNDAWLRGASLAGQWVLTVPFAWRKRLGYDGRLVSALTRIFVQTVLGFYRERGGGPPGGQSGAVVALHPFGYHEARQRTSSDLKLNPHVHAVFLDGAYREEGDELDFRAVGHLSTRDVQLWPPLGTWLSEHVRLAPDSPIRVGAQLFLYAWLALNMLGAWVAKELSRHAKPWVRALAPWVLHISGYGPFLCAVTFAAYVKDLGQDRQDRKSGLTFPNGDQVSRFGTSPQKIQEKLLKFSMVWCLQFIEECEDETSKRSLHSLLCLWGRCHPQSLAPPVTAVTSSRSR
jgi:hypothetical protein